MVRHEDIDKENAKTNGMKIKSKARPRASKVSKVHCICRKPDDGSPMIRCQECKEWYHFQCIKLDGRDAEDIQTYVCQSCHERTGLRTIMEWEGVDGLEEVDDGNRKKALAAEDEDVESDSDVTSNTDNGSGDEYVAERASEIVVVKRRSRRVSVSTNSGSESDRSTKKPKTPKQLRKTSTAFQNNGIRKSASPGLINAAKRKNLSPSHSPAKRAKSGSGVDPARKYCLTKLEEIFYPIFLRYPLFEGEGRAEGLELDKKEEDLTDKEKEKLEMTAKHFAADLEQCVFDLYSELDKGGKRTVGSKYKERFRMLTFNLSKSDRVLLHKRIASLTLSAHELSTMSSTELADEETKQSIKQAEAAALAHSILKKQTLPRAKITHKGIENIEDVNGAERDPERAREEQEEEDRIERERQARLRLQAERARSASIHGQGSVPPESPVIPQTAGWGAPPPVPLHVAQPDVDVGTSVPDMPRPSANPLFVPSASEYQAPVEGELNLADLINIDEDIPGDVPAIATPTSMPFDEDTQLPSESQPAATQSTLPFTPPTPSTGISPFAARPDDASHSFDLNTLWTPKGDTPEQEQSTQVQVAETPQQGDTDVIMESEALGQAADDQDFDMFLGKDEEDKPAAQPEDNSPEALRAAFETLPKVWTGTLSMPLDSVMAQDVSLNARQAGGRSLGGDSPLWGTLFPSKELRIDGRVQVEKSAQYLTQMRLNPSKELIAVAFSPESGPGGESVGFKSLIDHLIAKGRHGLVFPWGNRPKEYAPGREFYIVPLLTTEQIPEYMELLDDLRLPRVRKSNYLVGIWVLNKGKLAPPPPPTAPPAPAISGAPDVQLPQALLDLLPSVIHQSQSQPSPLSTTAPPMQHTPALAAQVAQLTPEQIQLMLRTLTSSTLLPQQPASGVVPVPGVSPPQPPLSAVSQPPPPPTYTQAIPLQPWLNPSTSFPPSYQPPPQDMYHSQQGQPPSRSYPDMHYDHYERDQDGPRGRYPDTPGDRGYRGRGGGRSRGRGGRDHDRSRDSGWPRGRRGRGGGSSPARGRGRSDHPGWS